MDFSGDFRQIPRFDTAKKMLRDNAMASRAPLRHDSAAGETEFAWRQLRLSAFSRCRSYRMLMASSRHIIICRYLQRNNIISVIDACLPAACRRFQMGDLSGPNAELQLNAISSRPLGWPMTRRDDLMPTRQYRRRSHDLNIRLIRLRRYVRYQEDIFA